MMVAMQVADGQLTPRIIATTLLRDNVIRVTVWIDSRSRCFFAAGVKARSDEMILHFGGTVAVLLGISSTMAFLFLIDYTARLKLPRFRGHWNICVGGVHDGNDETTLPT